MLWLAGLTLLMLWLQFWPRTSAQRLERRAPAPAPLTRRRAPTASQSVAALSAFSSEIRVGTPPRTALAVALKPYPSLCPETQQALVVDGQVVDALQADARSQQLPEWAALSTVWSMSEHRGVSLRPVADQLAEYGRRSVAVRHLLAAELAEARATVKVLAMLPLAGIALGLILGANPLRWLLTTSAGLVMLAIAVTLECLGWLWVRRIVRRVENSL